MERTARLFGLLMMKLAWPFVVGGVLGGKVSCPLWVLTLCCSCVFAIGNE